MSYSSSNVGNFKLEVSKNDRTDSSSLFRQAMGSLIGSQSALPNQSSH